MKEKYKNEGDINPIEKVEEEKFKTKKKQIKYNP